MGDGLRGGCKGNKGNGEGERREARQEVTSARLQSELPSSGPRGEGEAKLAQFTSTKMLVDTVLFMLPSIQNVPMPIPCRESHGRGRLLFPKKEEEKDIRAENCQIMRTQIDGFSRTPNQ